MKASPVRSNDGGCVAVSSSSPSPSPSSSRPRPTPIRRGRTPSIPLTHPADEQKQRPSDLPLTSLPHPSPTDDWSSAAASYEEKHRPCDELDLCDDFLTPSPPPSTSLTCPLCMEPLDPTDLAFHPCPCSYQLCLYCFNQLCLHSTPSCPACRREYDLIALASSTPSSLLSLTPTLDRTQRKRTRDRSKHRHTPPHPTQPSPASFNLTNVRIIQRNLVYVMGLQGHLAHEEVLKKREWFGRFGKIVKASVTRRQGGGGEGGTVYSAYVTYKTSSSAAAAIAALNGAVQQGCNLRCTYGTTKYCAFFVRGSPCTNTQCLYLHELARAEDCVSKEELSQEDKMMDRHTTPHQPTPHHANGLSSNSPTSHPLPLPAPIPATTAPAPSLASIPTISIFDFPLPSQPILLLSSAPSVLPSPAPAPTRSTSEAWAAVAAGTSNLSSPETFPSSSPSPPALSPAPPTLPPPPAIAIPTLPTWPALPLSTSATTLPAQPIHTDRASPLPPSLPSAARPPPGFDGVPPPLPSAAGSADVFSMLSLTSLLSSPPALPFPSSALPVPALAPPISSGGEAFDFSAFVEQLRATADLLPSLPSLTAPLCPLPPPRPIHQLQPLQPTIVNRPSPPVPAPPVGRAGAAPRPLAASAGSAGAEVGRASGRVEQGMEEDDWLAQAEAVEVVDAALPSPRSSGFDDSPPLTAWAALRLPAALSDPLPSSAPFPILPAALPAPSPPSPLPAVTARAPSLTPPNGRRVGLQSLPSAVSQLKAVAVALPAPPPPQPAAAPTPLTPAPPAAVSSPSVPSAKPILSLAPRGVNAATFPSSQPSVVAAVHRPAESTSALPLSVPISVQTPPPPIPSQSTPPLRPSGVRAISSLSHHSSKPSAPMHSQLTAPVIAIEQVGGGSTRGAGRGEGGQRGAGPR